MAQPRGFCAGVIRAIDIVERALEIQGAPVHVISTPEEVDALQVQDPQALVYVTQTTMSLDDTREVVAALKTRFPKIQGTGPIDIHPRRRVAAQQPVRQDARREVWLFQMNDEQRRMAGCWAQPEGPGPFSRNPALPLAYVAGLHCARGALSCEKMAAGAASWVNANRPHVNDICYPTQNRRHAVRELATQVEVLLVVGARNSSNSNRLREVREQVGLRLFQLPPIKSMEGSLPWAYR